MDRFEPLFQRVLQVSLQTTPEEMLNEYLRIGMELSGAVGGSILAEEGPMLQFLFSDVPSLIGVRVPWESIAGETARRCQVIYTYAPADKRHFAGIDEKIARRTRYLLSIPIVSIHMSTAAAAAVRSAGVLQLLFDDNILPDADVTQKPVEFSIAAFREQPCYELRLRELFWVLPNIAFGMEVMRLRQTSYQVIHELKNKLIGSQSWLVCLRDDLAAKSADLLADETIRDDLDLAETAAREGAELAKGYLQFTKIYSPQFRDADLNAVLAETVASVQAFADHHGGPGAVVVERDLAPGLPRRQLDPEQLKMAFFNLGKNAAEALIDHRVAGARVRYRSETTADGCRVIIEDNGPGIPEHIAANLFLPFQTKKAGGTGLGLTITKKIIEIHGGQIRCETGTGGTRFSITF